MQPENVDVLVIPYDGAKPVLVLTLPPTLDVLKPLVGGWLEGVSGLLEDDWHAYCNEEGKLQRLPINGRATALAHRLGWPVGDMLVGDVIFLGNGPEGAEADVPERIIAMAKEEFQDCPRCGGAFLKPGALSRTDNKTEVCPDCGHNEGLQAAAGVLAQQSAWRGL